jgi:hypothetical protein
MSQQNEMSATGRIQLRGVVKDLQHLRKSNVRPVSPVDGLVGRSLIEVFGEEVRSLRSEGTQISALVALFMQKLKLPPDSPLAKAGLAVSLKVEEASNQPHYHNQFHVVEVLLASFVLGQREHLPIYRSAELVIAAAAHDLGHNGESNHYDFERETYSTQIAQPLLVQAGLTDDAIQRIGQMILATDIRAGAPTAKQNYLDTRALGPNDDARLTAAQCLLLTEADILFSCFDMTYNDLLSKMLSAEMKRSQPNLSLGERLAFLSSVQFISDSARQLGLEERRQSLVKQISNTLLQQQQQSPS